MVGYIVQGSPSHCFQIIDYSFKGLIGGSGVNREKDSVLFRVRLRHCIYISLIVSKTYTKLTTIACDISLVIYYVDEW